MSVTYFTKTYGSYAYGNNAEAFGDEAGHRMRYSKSAGRDGAFANTALRDPRRISLKGQLVPVNAATQQILTDDADVRLVYDAWSSAHAAGPIRPLYLHSDRYLNAQVEHRSIQPWNGLDPYDWEVTFLAFDPFWYAAAATVLAAATSGPTAIHTLGSAYVLPVMTLVVSAPGTITLTNMAGDVCVIQPAAAGTYVLDSTVEAITLAGADATAILQSGDLLTFAGLDPNSGTGQDALTIALSGGAALTSAQVSWQDRWD